MNEAPPNPYTPQEIKDAIQFAKTICPMFLGKSVRVTHMALSLLLAGSEKSFGFEPEITASVLHQAREIKRP